MAKSLYEKKRTNFTGIIAMTLLVFVTAGIYFPGLNGPFVLDDTLNIFSDTHLQNLSPSSIFHIMTHNDSGILGRPISMLSFALTRYLHGDNPGDFKLWNIVIHLLCGILIYRLSKTLLGMQDRTQIHHEYVAVGASAFWLLHPIHVSGVLYTVQRMNQLSALFALASILCYVSFVQTNDKLHKLSFAFGCLLLCICSTLSKENGFLIPVYLAAIEFVFFQNKEPPTNEHRLRGRVILALAIIVLGIICIIGLSDSIQSHYLIRDFSVQERLLTQLHGLSFYIQQIAIPNPLRMSVFHDDFPISRDLDAGTAILLLALASTTVYAVTNIQHHRALSLASIWFLGGHFMESTFLPLEPIFEHRNYMPSIGISIGAAMGFSHICRLIGRRFTTFAALYSVLLASLTILAVGDWSNYHTWLINTMLKHPDSPRAHIELASASGGNLEQSRKHLALAANIAKKEAGPLIQLLATYCNFPSPPSRAILEETRSRLQYGILSGYTMSALHGLGESISLSRCANITAAQHENLCLAGVANRAYSKIPAIRSQILWSLAQSKIGMRQIDSAIALLQASHEANPKDLRPLLASAQLQIDEGRFDAADQNIKRITEIDNDSWRVYEKLNIIMLTDKLSQLRRAETSPHRN
jgi:protein O-mannosyl-transferase